MTGKIVQTRTFLTLLGGGSTHFSHVNQALSLAPILVAADGGADAALSWGLEVAAVIGDMDSINPATSAAIPAEKIHQIAEQDSTDFEKCLQRVEARAVLALGFTGKRLDHTLAACSVLARYPDLPVILIGEEDLCFLAPASFEIDLPKGSVFSIFPLAPVRGRSTGLKYPLDGIELSPLDRVGTSNEVTGVVRCQFDSSRPLILVPHAALEAVLDMLAPEAVA